MSVKKNPSSLANKLRAEGAPALGTMETNTKLKINPIGFYNPQKKKFTTLWTNYDLNQCVARYVWEGLPNGITSWNIERMLYFRGSLAGFSFAGNVYILPYVMTEGINPYGLPVGIRPLTYNGRAVAGKNDLWKDNFALPIDINGDEKTDANAVLLYDSIPYSPSAEAPSRFFFNQIIINEIADTMARVNINVVVSNKKILLVIKDAKQADTVRKELEATFDSDCPFGVITSPLETNSVQSTSDFDADKLISLVKNYDGIRKIMNGILANFGTDKGERLVTGELQGNEQQVDLIADLSLELRQLFCKQCNAKWGLNMKVRKRSDDYKKETNGNNKTQKQEEKELNE